MLVDFEVVCLCGFFCIKIELASSLSLSNEEAQQVIGTINKYYEILGNVPCVQFATDAVFDGLTIVDFLASFECRVQKSCLGEVGASIAEFSVSIVSGLSESRKTKLGRERCLRFLPL